MTIGNGDGDDDDVSAFFSVSESYSEIIFQFVA